MGAVAGPGQISEGRFWHLQGGRARSHRRTLWQRLATAGGKTRDTRGHERRRTARLYILPGLSLLQAEHVERPGDPGEQVRVLAVARSAFGKQNVSRYGGRHRQTGSF